jgi:hypothetical protein
MKRDEASELPRRCTSQDARGNCKPWASGGYLVGFVAAAAVTGALAERRWDRQFASSLGALLTGDRRPDQALPRRGRPPDSLALRNRGKKETLNGIAAWRYGT